jgi:HEAT repeat protein
MGLEATPAVPALRELLEDKDQDVRDVAAAALEYIETNTKKQGDVNHDIGMAW